MLLQLGFPHTMCRSSSVASGDQLQGRVCMNMRGRLYRGLTTGVFLMGASANAQDSQSLGEVARQQRQQKEQSANVQGQNAVASRVVTNEEIPEHTRDETASAVRKDKSGVSRILASKTAKQPAEYWQSRIRVQKGQIASLQRRIDEINGSIRFSSINCGANCVLRNERQKSKQQQVEQKQGELDQQKKRLEEMQEAARKQGYGSSVYDP